MAPPRAQRRHKNRRRADMSLVGGVRPPIAVLSALLLALTALTALSLGRIDQNGIPGAVRASQQHFAEDGAIALRASLDESVTDLRRTAALFSSGEPAGADQVLDKLGDVYQKWRGTAVVEITSGRLLAARGETVPLTVIDRTKLSDKDGLAPRMIRLENGETRLLSFALLSWPDKPQALLIASSTLRFPGISLGKFRAIAVLDSAGQILSTDGIPAPEQVLTDAQRREVKHSNAQLRYFAKAAGKNARRHPLQAKEPGSGGFLGVSGSLTGDLYLGDRTVAGYATLAAPQPGETTDATGLGLTVLAMVPVAEDHTRSSSPLFAAGAAGALLLIGGLVVFLLVRGLQRPLLGLFLESRRLSRGELRRPVAVPKSGEAARIGAALERLRRQLLGEPPGAQDKPRRRLCGTRSLLAVCAVLLLAWSAPLTLKLNRADDTVIVPQQVVNDQRERTDTLTDRVRRALNEGHADLRSVATLFGEDTAPRQMKADLKLTYEEHLRYQSLYVLDDGRVLARAGDDPSGRAGSHRARTGIAVLNHSGKKPVVAGYAKIPGRKGAYVVGEFRIDFLNSLLKRPGLGTVRVVDADHRAIAGNTGYRAFQGLGSTDLDALVSGANVTVGLTPRAGSVVYREGDGVQIAAAAPFVGGGAAKTLGWTVVSWQEASGLEIPEYNLQHRTTLVGILGLTAAAACLGWLHIVVVRPLRALARQAEALAAGDRRTVLFPRQQDEVGAVVRGLELIRQWLQDQHSPGRAGRAPRTPAGRS